LSRLFTRPRLWQAEEEIEFDCGELQDLAGERRGARAFAQFEIADKRWLASGARRRGGEDGAADDGAEAGGR